MNNAVLELDKALFCILIFAWSFRKKEFFPARFVVAFLAEGILSVFLMSLDNLLGPAVSPVLVRVLTHTLFRLSILAAIAFCYEESLSEYLLCWCMIVATESFSGKKLFLSAESLRY